MIGTKQMDLTILQQDKYNTVATLQDQNQN